MKKFLVWILLVLIIIAICWLIYLSVGRTIIESAYKGESLTFLNRIVSGAEENDLQFYYDKAERYLLFYSIILVMTGFFAFPIIWLIGKIENNFKGLSPKKLYLGTSILLFILFVASALFYQPATYRYGYDYWEHSAVIKEWSSNLWHPNNPHIATQTTSMRFMPYFFLLSAAARIFQLTPFQALGLGAIFNIGVLLIGVFLFFRKYFKNDWAPLFGLIILLTGWGIGFSWSNLYQLRSLFSVVSYPSFFVFAWTFILLWLTLKILREEQFLSKGLFTLGILAPIMLLSHPLTAIFTLVAICLLAVTETGADLKIRFLIIGSLILGSVLVLFWPYFSLLNAVKHQAERSFTFPSTFIDSSYNFYQLKRVLFLLGPALLGILVISRLLFKKKHIFISAGFGAMLFPYILNILVNVPLGKRFLLYAVFFLHMALLQIVLQLFSKREYKAKKSLFIKYGRGVIFGIIALSFGWNVSLAIFEFVGYNPGIKFTAPFNPVKKDMTRISYHIPEDAIVLAPPKLSGPLPSFSGKVVINSHYNPFLKDAAQRANDVNLFFSEQTTHERRIEILNRYNVSHVLYDEEEVSKSIVESLTLVGENMSQINGYRVVQITVPNDKNIVEM
jgi:hypothetical protein